MKIHPGKLLLALSPLIIWLAASRIDRGPVEGIWTLRGVRFDVIYFFPPAQRETIVVLACPGEDLIRLWPLPIRQPWYEDPPSSPGIELTRR